MEGVIEASEAEDAPPFARWIAESIAKNPENHANVLAHDPHVFADVLRSWYNWTGAGKPGLLRLHLANLTTDELAKIDVPVLVQPGDDGPDGVHPEHVARELYALLPNARWMDYSLRYSEKDIVERRSMGRGAPSTLIAFDAPFYEDFLDSVETGRLVTDK